MTQSGGLRSPAFALVPARVGTASRRGGTAALCRRKKNILTSACMFAIINFACGGCGEAAERTGLWLRHSRVQISSPTPPLLGAAGVSPSGKARDFDSLIRRSDSCHPSQYEPLAQPVEHLTFNQGVRSSNLRWLTKKGPAPASPFLIKQQLFTACSRRSRHFLFAEERGRAAGHS